MGSDGSSQVIRVLAWPYRRSDNPYTRDLYDAMVELEPRRVTIDEFRFGDAWRQRPDVVHVHWPEAAVESPSRLRATVKSLVLVLTLRRLRHRGARLVWTCHNLHSHERHHVRVEKVLRHQFFHQVDGVIHLSPGSPAEVERLIPALAGVPTVVVRHGVGRVDQMPPPTKAAARAELRLGSDDLVLLAAGSIRPYKQAPALIRAFDAADLGKARLLIAGRPSSPEVESEVRQAAAATRAVVLELGWLNTRTLATYLAAADVVVCPYSEIHNSGVAISALAQGRPVLCRQSAATEDLRGMVGSDWVTLLDGPITAGALQRHASWMRTARRGAPDLRSFEPHRVAGATVDAYRYFLGAARGSSGEHSRDATPSV